MRIPYISLLAAGALTLGGCAYDGLGMGLGYGDPYYGGYGYNSAYGYGSPYYGSSYYGSPYYGGHSGVSIGVGYGSGYGGYGYGSPYYGGYGYGSPYYGGYSPFGWYNNYYYPGTGSYVYDTYRQPHVMSTTQRQYWSSRSPAFRTTTTSTRTNVKPNWSAFNQRRSANQSAREARAQAREDRRTHHND